MFAKNVLINFFISFTVFYLSILNSSFSDDYLNSVINRINIMEGELKNLQNKNSEKKLTSSSSANNTIASHEQRLMDLEEEFRIINGRLDEVLFKLNQLNNEVKVFNEKNTTMENTFNNNATDNSSSVIIAEENNSDVITTQDPNMKKNPTMKVLGIIKDDEINNNSNEKNKNLLIEEDKKNDNNSISAEQIATLKKKPSEIYKHAYNLLIEEKFSEAEKYFNIFIGENPNDPLSSNAYYWLGETFYVQKQFQKAAISFAKGYQTFPKGNKALDQLFKLSLTFINLGKNDDACASFSKLEMEFPKAPERIKSRTKEYRTRAKC